MSAPKRNFNNQVSSEAGRTRSPFITLLKHRSFLRGGSEWLGMAFITLAVVSYESTVSQALSVLPYAVTAKFIWIRANIYLWDSSGKK